MSNIDKTVASFVAGKSKSYARCSVHSDGDRFYSYGMPIGIRTPRRRGKPVVIVNGDRVSNSTSRHQGALLQGLRRAKEPHITVSFSALAPQVGATRVGAWGTNQAREMADKIAGGELSLLDYSDDQRLYQTSHPRAYSDTPTSDHPPSPAEGWTVRHYKPDGADREYWSAHRPGAALFLFQPPATAGPNPPYTLQVGKPADVDYPLGEWEKEHYPDSNYLVIKDCDGELYDSCRGPEDHSNSLRYGFVTSNGKCYQSIEEWRADYQARVDALNNTTPPPALHLLVGMDDGSYFCCANARQAPHRCRRLRAVHAQGREGRLLQRCGGQAPGRVVLRPRQRRRRRPPHPVAHGHPRGIKVRKGAALPLQTPTSNKHICTRIYEKGSVRYVVGRVRHDAGRRPSWGRRRGDHPMLTLYDGPLYRVYENKAIRSTSSAGRVD